MRWQKKTKGYRQPSLWRIIIHFVWGCRCPTSLFEQLPLSHFVNKFSKKITTKAIVLGSTLREFLSSLCMCAAWQKLPSSFKKKDDTELYTFFLLFFLPSFTYLLMQISHRRLIYHDSKCTDFTLKWSLEPMTLILRGGRIFFRVK